MSSEFSYLSQKIEGSKFKKEPFDHIVVDDFFTDEHFNKITNSKQIKTRKFETHKDVVDGLIGLGYEPQPFPGCITDVDEYIKFADKKNKINRSLIKGYGKNVIEGYGLTMRLNRIDDDFLVKLIKYLNGDEFQGVLKSKFLIEKEVSIETAYQKNLKHYEISPHCDTSRKALTYMINIYNNENVKDLEMHTSFLKFKKEYNYLYDFWKHSDYDPVWIPWGWCEEVKKTNTNNSISIFRPDYNTLHAIKVSEDHFENQRNQIYGNLWYDTPVKSKSTTWEKIDLINDSFSRKTKFEKLKHHLKESVKTIVK
jgi:hypothetical protein